MENVCVLRPARAAGALAVVMIAGAAAAQPLTGSGPNLPIPGPNPGEPARQGRALSGVTGAGFTGTWTAPALPDWIGSFNASGPVPAGTASPAGLTRYDFSTLPNGYLPTGTYYAFGDVDGGSTTSEMFLLQAFDTSNTLITNEWLDIPIGVSGVGTGGAGAILPGNTPGWEWDATFSRYTIDGTTVTGGNPTLNVWIENNTNIGFMDVERTSQFANFSLSAPIPAPGSVALLALCGCGVLRRRR